MALEERGGRLFVAFPEPPTLAPLHLETGSILRPLGLCGGGDGPLLHPRPLAPLALETGSILGQLAMCGDADDLFLDARRHRLYAVCGEGVVDVFDTPPARDGRSAAPRHLVRVPTSLGARTGLFVPELDRLF